MFDIDQMAKEHGTKVAEEARAGGASAVVAKLLGRDAERDFREQATDWTMRNVGLN